MMLRSTFWLVAAYLVIQPQGVDLEGAAEAAAAQAVATGQRVVIEHVLGGGCRTMDCLGVAALAAAPEAPQALAVVPDAPAIEAPVPRPRIARAG